MTPQYIIWHCVRGVDKTVVRGGSTPLTLPAIQTLGEVDLFSFDTGHTV